MFFCHTHLIGEGTEALMGPAAVSWDVELGGRPWDCGLPHHAPRSSRCQRCEAELTGEKVAAIGGPVCGWLVVPGGETTVFCYAGACDVAHLGTR